jgi:hypothetical protein
MDRWRRFRRLSRAEQGVLLRALILLPVTAAGLRVFGFRRWQSVLARWGSARNKRGDNFAGDLLETARMAARMVNAAGRHGLGRPNCLKQSLVLCWLLRRDGIPAVLRIGVRKESGRFQAHAWVEYAGAVLNDSDEVHQHYAAFDSDIAPSPVSPR